MLSFPLARSGAVLGLLVLPLTSLAAPSLLLNGHEYTLSLSKNERLQGDGEHYLATLEGEAEAWGRVSRIGERWVGIVSLSGQKFRIDVPAAATAASDDGKARVVREVLRAESVDSYLDAPGTQCATRTPDQAAVSIAESTPVQQSALRTPVAQQVQFSQLCSNTVGGQCLLAELELVFDQQYQNVLGSEARAAANSMVNIVEGIYQNDLNVAFDVLSTTFLTAPQFSSTTVAGDLLDDVQARKSGLSFVENQRALLHLVTGRNFDGGTAGIAFSDVLCDNNGFSVGTSQILASGGGSDYVSLTSLVIAHELGHNFGAGHDGEDNSCGTGFIMEPTISSSNQSFSSCSIDEIRNSIGGIAESRLTSCFNFPLALAITADNANATEVDAGEDFTSTFTVNTETAFRGLSQLTINGSVNAAAARFSSVSAGGNACQVANDGASYQCSLGNPSGAINLQVVTRALNGTADFSHVLQYLDSELIEAVTSDNSVQQQVAINGTAPPPQPEPEPEPPQPEPQPPQPEPEPPQPEPQPPVVDSSDSGGGGGAASPLVSLMLLSLLYWRRKWGAH